jgi:hypothetical protein
MTGTDDPMNSPAAPAPGTETAAANRPVRTATALLTLFFFSFWPTVNFIAKNVPLAIDPVPVLGVSAAVFAAAAAILFLGYVVLGAASRERVAAVVCVGAFFFFMVQPVRAGLSWAGVSASILGVWAVLALAAAVLAWLLTARRRNFILLTTVGGIGFLAATAGLVAEIAALPAAPSGTSAPGAPSRTASSGDAAAPDEARKLPPVVYIIVDTYTRPDELRRQTGYDSADFIRALEARGFRTLKRSTSNYFFSNLSISNTLSMRYLMDGTDNEISTYSEVWPIMGGRNAVARRFGELGYRMVTSGHRLCSNYDHTCIVNSSGIPYGVWEFLLTTPMPVLLSYVSPALYGEISAGQEYRLEDLIGVVEDFSFDRLFLLVHELGVHDNLYEEDCSFQDKLAQSDLQRQNRQDRQTDEKTPFVKTVKCANKLLIRFVDMIRLKAPDAIVVVTADHGTGFSRAAGERSPTVVRERSAVLSAWRLPPRCNSLLYDTMSNVNHFRAIFACLTGEKPDYLKDRVFTGLDFPDVREAQLPE